MLSARRRWLAFGLVASIAAGCAFDWDFPADSSGGDEGGIDAPVSDRVMPIEASPPNDGGVDAGGRPCTKSADCSGSVKQYCHFSDYLCGDGGATGKCTDLPDACAADDEVCSCDGKTYANECDAIEPTGLDLSKKGCAFDAGTQFRCGTHICEQDKEYCLQGSSPLSFACKTLGVTTNNCAPISCTCPAIMDMKCISCAGSPGEITLSGCP